MNTCPNCYHEYSEDVDTCPKCGFVPGQVFKAEWLKEMTYTFKCSPCSKKDWARLLSWYSSAYSPGEDVLVMSGYAYYPATIIYYAGSGIYGVRYQGDPVVYQKEVGELMKWARAN